MDLRLDLLNAVSVIIRKRKIKINNWIFGFEQSLKIDENKSLLSFFLMRYFLLMFY
jgi:hypothetical protein